MKKILAAAAKKALVNMLLEVAIKVLTAYGGRHPRAG